MIHVALWLNMISFALLFAGFGAEMLAWLRRRESWRALYLWYIGMYAVFSFLQTFAFFNMRYLERPIPGLSAAFAYFRTAISIVLIAVISQYLAKASGLRLGKAGRSALFLPAAATAVVIAGLFAGAPPVLGVALNLAYNAAIALASFLAARRVAAGKADTPRSEVLPFLRLSALLFALLTLLGIAMVTGMVQGGSAPIAVGVNGVFCLAWGLLLVVSAFRRARPEPSLGEGLHPRFMADYAFSPREAEVIELLVQGLSNKEIGEKLFIASRTVETHVYNIYRKCGCRNKVELLNKARSYAGAGIA